MTTLALVQQDADPFQIVSDFLSSQALQIAGQLLLLIVVVFWLALVYWTYADASRRGSISILWGIVAVIFPYLGTLIYLIVRPPEFLAESRERELEAAYLERELRSRVTLCPNCRNMVENDYIICPVCNWELKKSCINCDKPMNMDWDTCPFCSTDQRSGKRLV